MQSSLWRIRATVQDVATAISLALQVEVEVADAELIRIAGTGGLGAHIGSRMPDTGYLFSRVLSSGEVAIVDNPGSHSCCQPCRRRGDCYATAEICCPILMGGEPIGVIGLMARDQAQQERLLGSRQQNLDFLRQMAAVLGSKAHEVQLQDRTALLGDLLQRVMNYVDQGILVIDAHGQITSLNSHAAGLLGLNPAEARGKRLLEVAQGEPLSRFLLTGGGCKDRRAQITSANRRLDALLSIHAVRHGAELLGAAITLRDYRDLARGLVADKQYTFDDLIGASCGLQRVKERACLVAAGDSTVLIRGESGTGKEILARAIHAASPRSRYPFVAISCGAIPDALLESELFGYEEGAFTGAKKGGKPGRFELASGGTMFLDEVGDMPLHLQVKLLRALQERCIERVGGQGSIPLDVRIIAATHRDLESMANRGEFRWDLYYRLNVIPLEMPPLRQRPEDIPVIAAHYLGVYAGQLQKSIRGFSAGARRLLLGYGWPGNVRELANAVEYAVNLEQGAEIAPESLPERLKTPGANGEEGKLGQLEVEEIQAAMQRFGATLEGKKMAADYLGISLATLYRKLKRYGIS